VNGFPSGKTRFERFGYTSTILVFQKSPNRFLEVPGYRLDHPDSIESEYGSARTTDVILKTIVYNRVFQIVAPTLKKTQELDVQSSEVIAGSVGLEKLLQNVRKNLLNHPKGTLKTMNFLRAYESTGKYSKRSY
jgi:hypothetical protein